MDWSRSRACGETFGFRGWLGKEVRELLLRSDNNKWLSGWWDEVLFLVGKILTSNNSLFFWWTFGGVDRFMIWQKWGLRISFVENQWLLGENPRSKLVDHNSTYEVYIIGSLNFSKKPVVHNNAFFHLNMDYPWFKICDPRNPSWPNMTPLFPFERGSLETLKINDSASHPYLPRKKRGP